MVNIVSTDGLFLVARLDRVSLNTSWISIDGLNQHRLVQVVWDLFPLSKVSGSSLVNGENL